MYIYIKIYKNKLSITTNKITHYQDILPDSKFSNDRLLIANIDNAVDAFKKSLESLNIRKSLFGLKTFILHPKELILNDFSQVDERILQEVAYRSGASDVYVYLGKDLANNELDNNLRDQLQKSNNYMT